MEEVEAKVKSFKNLWFFAGCGLALILLILIFVCFFFVDSDQDICGDGTSYGECSVDKPYFCEEGVLIEKASVCGCPDLLSIKQDLCKSNLEKGLKELSLRYFLSDGEGRLIFDGYKDFEDYLAELPKTIDYNESAVPSRRDFHLRDINEPLQRELILPLVKDIENLASDKDDQARIAISLVQNIPYKSSDKVVDLWYGSSVNYSRYPYEVLYDVAGVCEEKSELLALLLKELGFGVAIFYYPEENHASVGVACPAEESINESGYCFVETTGPAIITDDKIVYVGGMRLKSNPEIFIISEGVSLSKNLKEYSDAEKLDKLREELYDGSFGMIDEWRFGKLREKYHLASEYYLE